MLKRESNNGIFILTGKQQLIFDTGVSKTRTIYSTCILLTLL